jgi:hypothetical protein
MNTTFLRRLREDLRSILSDGSARDAKARVEGVLDVMNWTKTNPQYCYRKNSTSSTSEIERGKNDFR